MPPLTASQELRALGKAAKTAPAKDPGPSRDSSPGRAASSPGQAASGAARDPGPAKDSAPKPSPGDAYGPDDPDYGPPDHDWYERRKRERALEMEREEEEFLAEAAEEIPKPTPASSAPSVFEPRSSRQSGSGAAEETSLDQFLKSDDGTDFERDPLERVKDLYLAAEAVSDSDLDRRLEELLERQRGLIGAYLSQSRPPIP